MQKDKKINGNFMTENKLGLISGFDQSNGFMTNLNLFL